jgi:hypothetical protein
MSLLSTEKGAISFKVILILLVLFVVIHVGVKMVPMYMTAEQMKDEMAGKSRFAQTLKDEDITKALVQKAKELDLPLGPEDFKLLRDENTQRLKISTAWNVELHFFFDIYPPYTVKTYHFEPVVEEDYTRKF